VVPTRPKEFVVLQRIHSDTDSPLFIAIGPKEISKISNIFLFKLPQVKKEAVGVASFHDSFAAL